MVWRTEDVEQKKVQQNGFVELFLLNCAILSNLFGSTARKFKRTVAFSLVLRWFGGPRVLNKKSSTKRFRWTFFVQLRDFSELFPLNGQKVQQNCCVFIGFTMVWRTEGVEQKKFHKPVSLNFFCSTARFCWTFFVQRPESTALLRFRWFYNGLADRGCWTKKVPQTGFVELFLFNCAILLNFFCSTARKYSIVAFSLVLQWFGGPGGGRQKAERGKGEGRR